MGVLVEEGKGKRERGRERKVEGAGERGMERAGVVELRDEGRTGKDIVM